MTTPAPARRAAYEILLDVEKGKLHSDELLRARRIRALAEPDRNLTTTLVYGVLRWQLALDHAVNPLLKRPGARLDPEVRIALRLGAFQLLFLDRIPAHAVLNDSVNLTKHAGHKFSAGMVNAVLRRLAAAPRTPLDDTAAYPDWLLSRWRAHFGEEAAAAICLDGMTQATTALRLADPAAEAEMEAAGVTLAHAPLLTRARLVLSGEVIPTPAFRAGRVRLQDEGSQLVGEIAAFSDPLAPKIKKILDACAAPGGKTFILAERNPTARILACESNPQRHASLAKRLAALAPRVECRLADSTALAEKALFDLALVDAPCSGTGTLGRNPEIRHRLSPDDLPRQSARQQAILAAALRAVRPGGLVLYSTCSLEPEENDQVIAAALASALKARILPLAPRLAAMEKAGILTKQGAASLAAALTPEGFLRLLPGRHSTDGFFIAALTV